MAEVTPEITEAIDVLSLRRLLEISNTLSATLNLKQLLLMVIDTATDLTGTEAASMLLVDRRSGELQFVAATGMQAPKEGYSEETGLGLAITKKIVEAHNGRL